MANPENPAVGEHLSDAADTHIHYLIAIDLESHDDPQTVFDEIEALMAKKGVGCVSMHQLKSVITPTGEYSSFPMDGIAHHDIRRVAASVVNDRIVEWDEL